MLDAAASAAGGPLTRLTSRQGPDVSWPSIETSTGCDSSRSRKSPTYTGTRTQSARFARPRRPAHPRRRPGLAPRAGAITCPSNGAARASSPRALTAPRLSESSRLCAASDAAAAADPIGTRLLHRSNAGGSFLEKLLLPLQSLRRLRESRVCFTNQTLRFRTHVTLGLLQRHELEDHVAALDEPDVCRAASRERAGNWRGDDARTCQAGR